MNVEEELSLRDSRLPIKTEPGYFVRDAARAKAERAEGKLLELVDADGKLVATISVIGPANG